MSRIEKPRNIKDVARRVTYGLIGVGGLAMAAVAAEATVVNLLQVPQPHIPFIETLQQPSRDWFTDMGLAVFVGLGGPVSAAFLHQGITSNKQISWFGPDFA